MIFSFRKFFFRIAPIFLLGIFFLVASDVHASALIKPSNNVGLVGQWKFDEGSGGVANDTSVNTNTGTLTLMDTSSSWVLGKYATALDFDGEDSYVDVGNDSSLNPTAGMTILAWIRPESFGYGPMTIIERLYGSSYVLYAENTLESLIFSVNGVDFNSPPVTVTLNQWQHLAVTYDGSTVVFYVNGEEVSTLAGGPGPINIDTEIVRIGNDSSFSSPFDGQMDDVHVYNRPLTRAEVISVMRGGKIAIQAKTPPASGDLANGLVGWYTFDGREMSWYSGQVSDMSGAANHGYVAGLATTSAAFAGRIGQALYFDGLNDYVRTEAVTFSGDFSGSYCVWINLPTLSTSGAILSQGSNIEMEGFGLFVGGHGAGRFSAEYFGNRSVITGPVLTAGVWQHLCVTKTPGPIDTTTKIYLNAVLQPTTSANSDTPNFVPSLPLVIGGDGVSLGTGVVNAFVRAALDDVRIYNRALSVDTINKLYRMGQTTYSSTLSGGNSLLEGLSGWWTFDGKDVQWGSGVVSDASGSGKHGYVVGMSTSSAGVGGKVGQAFTFDGVDDYVDISGNVGAVRTISFWVSPATLSEQVIALSATENIEVAGGTITTNGFAASAVYVDGVVSSTLPNTKWHHVTITVAGGVTADAVELGRVGAALYNGALDDVRAYNRVLSATEILRIYQATR